MLPEEMTTDTSDNMGNAGEITFVSNFRIAFQVLVVNNDPALGEQEVDKAYWAITNGLWRDKALTNFFSTWDRNLPGGPGYASLLNARFESIIRATRRHAFGNAGTNNSIPFVELRYEITVRSREDFSPIITDDLLRIHEEFFPGPIMEDGTMRGVVEYDFTQSPAAPPGDKAYWAPIKSSKGANGNVQHQSILQGSDTGAQGVDGAGTEGDAATPRGDEGGNKNPGGEGGSGT
jgi:hypothetical protein